MTFQWDATAHGPCSLELTLCEAATVCGMCGAEAWEHDGWMRRQSVPFRRVTFKGEEHEPGSLECVRGPMKILIAEDDELAAIIASKQPKSNGHGYDANGALVESEHDESTCPHGAPVEDGGSARDSLVDALFDAASKHVDCGECSARCAGWWIHRDRPTPLTCSCGFRDLQAAVRMLRP